MITINRHQDITCGHLVNNNDHPKTHLHRFRINFRCQLEDANDFLIVDSKLCSWVKKEWDNKFLYQENNNLISTILGTHMPELDRSEIQDLFEFFVPLPFNPTAEKLAVYLLDFIGPEQLTHTNIKLIKVSIYGDRHCYGYANEDSK